jgi:hypothetical protein
MLQVTSKLKSEETDMGGTVDGGATTAAALGGSGGSQGGERAPPWDVCEGWLAFPSARLWPLFRQLKERKQKNFCGPFFHVLPVCRMKQGAK